jgi:hypothetical protein
MKIAAAGLKCPPAMLASGWMHICCKIRSGYLRMGSLRANFAGVVVMAIASSLIFVMGCASPGPPLPPSLKLPEIVKDLKVTRVGDEVKLRWTTPSRTTDGFDITGPMTAEICREMLTVAPASQPVGKTAPVCSPVVAKEPVKEGASEWSGALAAELIAGSPRLLAYRVQLRNASGKTAGASAAAFAASGPAPLAVEGLHGTGVKGGVMLEWKAEGSGSGDVVELDRTLQKALVAASAPERRSGLGSKPKEAAELRLRVAAKAGGGDPGGTVDRTALLGESYRYTAERVRTVAVGGQNLEVRSAASGTVTVAMLDVFPPNAPGGLVASPGFVSGTGGAQRPAIDLSWEPGIEARIAGYRVYRKDEDNGVWVRLNPTLVAVPAYQDATVEAGRRYAYRVTAVDETGNESGPGGEVEETAPAR